MKGINHVTEPRFDTLYGTYKVQFGWYIDMVFEMAFKSQIMRALTTEIEFKASYG